MASLLLHAIHIPETLCSMAILLAHSELFPPAGDPTAQTSTLHDGLGKSGSVFCLSQFSKTVLRWLSASSWEQFSVSKVHWAMPKMLPISIHLPSTGLRAMSTEPRTVMSEKNWWLLPYNYYKQQVINLPISLSSASFSSGRQQRESVPSTEMTKSYSHSTMEAWSVVENSWICKVTIHYALTCKVRCKILSSS